MVRILCADIASAEEWMYQRLYDQASPERKCRADRYRRQEDRLRCVTADALVRLALGTEEYQIIKKGSGKPYIQGREDFFYNLSHSGRYVVIAWSNREVGVDVQKHDSGVNVQAVARRYFTEEEQDCVQENARKFYEIWTKKESYIKYTGQGLMQGLNSVHVLAPELPLRYYTRFLEGGYSLSVCTTEAGYTLKIIDIRNLLV